MDVIVELLGTLSGEAFGFVASLLVRGAALLALALVTTALLLRRAPAAARHQAWALAMAGLVALPLLSGALPDWRVELPGTAVVSRVAASAATAVGAAAASWTAPDERPTEPGATAGAPLGTAGRELHDPRIPRDVRREGTSAAGGPNRAGPAGPGIVLLVWATGAALLFGRLAAGLLRAEWLVRRARPVNDRRWNLLVSELSLRCGLEETARVVVSRHVDVPMAWGLTRSWLVLPAGIESWPEERQRVVVLHELAHLQRRDCQAQALARLALALHWPNPLAWVAVRRMCAERELACDDAVLVSGVRAPAYAHHLVEIARGLSRGARPVRAAVAMARPSELENRVLAILDDRVRRPGLGRRTVRLGLLGFAALLLPLASLQPAEAGSDPAPDEPPSSVAGASAEAATEGAMDTDPAKDTGPAAAIGTESDVEAQTNPLAGADGEVEPDAGAADGGPEAAARVPQQRSGAGAGMPADTIEERVFRALERALASGDVAARRQVAHTLGNIESPRGVEPLARLVRNDPDAGVRRTAAWALGMIESPDGVEPLAAALADEDAGVRKEATWALGMIESPDGVAPLLPLLGDESPALRRETAWALGMIESSEAVEAIEAAYAGEEVAEVRAELIWALGMIEDRAAAGTIVDALEDADPGVRKQALWAIGMVMD